MVSIGRCNIYSLTIYEKDVKNETKTKNILHRRAKIIVMSLNGHEQPVDEHQPFLMIAKSRPSAPVF